MTHFASIGYALWWRSRVGLLASIGFVYLFTLYLYVVGRENLPPLPAVVGTIGSLTALLVLMGIFMYQDADVSTRGSAYPAYMLTLPVKTRTLVLFPMITGTITLSLVMLPITIVLQLGNSGIVVWPVAMIAMLLAVFQAIFWFPIGIPYSKMILTLASLIGLAVGLGICSDRRVSDTWMVVGMFAITLVCYVVTTYGVERARRGDSFARKHTGTQDEEREEEVRKQPKAPTRILPPFRSAGSAQQWYEWRQHGKILPIFGAILFLAFGIPMQWDTTRSPVVFLGQVQPGYYLSLPTYINVYFPALVCFILFVAWAVGCGARKSDSKHGDRTLHLFFGVRPMSDASLFFQKIKAAGRSSIITWTLLLSMCLLLANVRAGLFPVNVDTTPFIGATKPVLVAAAPFYTLTNFATLGCLVLIVIAATWRNYVVGFWSELSGSKFYYYAYPMGVITLFFATPAISAMLRSYGYVSLTFQNYLTALLVVNGIRLITAAALAVNLVTARVLKLKQVAVASACYIVGVSILIGLLFFIMNPHWGELSEALSIDIKSLQLGLICITLVWTPFVRLLLGVKMLSNNRHRIA